MVFPPSQASKEQVVRDVASRLEKAGFTLEARDFEVSVRNGLGSAISKVLSFLSIFFSLCSFIDLLISIVFFPVTG